MKMLALYVMDDKGVIGERRAYTGAELQQAMEDFLGEELPAKGGSRLLYDFCENSLAPAGFVLEERVARKGRLVKAYSITDAGIAYKAIIEKFLLLADHLNTPLQELNGRSGTAGKVQHGYVLAKALEILSDGEVHTDSEIARAVGGRGRTFAVTFEHLKELGLVDYDSVKRDVHGESESRYSIAKLIDRDKLDDYLACESKLRKDMKETCPQFDVFGILGKVLQNRQETLESNAVAEKFGISKYSARETIAALCGLGVYSYEKFNNKWLVLSNASITEEGLKCFNDVYAPVLLFAKNTDSPQASKLFERLNDSARVLELFESEIERYRETNVKLDVRSGDESDVLVLDTIKRLESEEFWPNAIMRLLRKDGEKRNVRISLPAVLQRLVDENEIEKVRRGLYRRVRKESTE
jgi:DNA-binding PadR family transcriptional regulator